jgi:hypothetical protein
MNKKETLDLLKSVITNDGEPAFTKEYLETFLGIKTCKNCGVKDFDFEDYCKSCDRDNKIDELGIK